MKPNCVLGLATGGTPVGAYAQLVEWYNKGDLDFSEVTTVNLSLIHISPDGHSACCNVYCGTQVAIQEQIEADEVKIALGVLGEKFFPPKDVRNNPFQWEDWASPFWFSVLFVLMGVLAYYLWTRL